MKIESFQFRKSLTIFFVVIIVICSWYSPLQVLAAEMIDAGFKRALISFASARALNAIISVAQGTEFSVQPLGVGMSFTLGQVLDPINDLVEQFSSLMLMASVAFGLQKALLAIGGNWLVSSAVTGLAAVWAALHFFDRAPVWVSRMLVLLLLIRFAIPVVTIGSEKIFQEFLAQEYQTSKQALDLSIQSIEKNSEQPFETNTDKFIVEQLKEEGTGDADIKQKPDQTSTASVKSPVEQLKAQPTGKASDDADKSSIIKSSKSIWKRTKEKVTGMVTAEPSLINNAEQPPTSNPGKSVFQRLREKAAGMTKLKDRIAAIKLTLEKSAEQIITLITIFLLQTLVLPLFLFWLLYRFAGSIVWPKNDLSTSGH